MILDGSNRNDFTNDKTVLILSFRFPPLREFRVLKLQKYLSSYGWKSIVLCANKSKFAPIDRSQLRDVDNNTTVYRTHTFESKIYAFLPKIIGINQKWYHIPDYYIGWLPFAILKAKQIFRNEDIDVIYAAAPPFTTFLLALYLKRITGKPLVVDFKDPWTQNFNFTYPTKFHKKIEEYMELKTSQEANKIIFNTDPNMDDFFCKYQDVSNNKAVVIPNCFDPEDFEDVKKIKTDTFTITYTGSFYGDYNPKIFLSCINELITEGDLPENKIKIVMAGNFDKNSREIINSFPFKEIIDFKGYVSYEDSIDLMCASDVLLMYLPASNKHVARVQPWKLATYLATGKPILNIVPKGLTFDIVRDCSAGICICPDDNKEIKNAILQLYRNEAEYVHDSNKIRNFDVKYQCGQLTNLFDSLI